MKKDQKICQRIRKKPKSDESEKIKSEDEKSKEKSEEKKSKEKSEEISETFYPERSESISETKEEFLKKKS